LVPWKIIHFLPQSWKLKMGPSNSSYLSDIGIFHFHDYGRESMAGTYPEGCWVGNDDDVPFSIVVGCF